MGLLQIPYDFANPLRRVRRDIIHRVLTGHYTEWDGNNKDFTIRLRTGNHKLWTKFHEFRKQYNRALRQAHNAHITDIFSVYKDDSKKAFFKYVKDLRRDRCGISPLTSGYRIVSDPQGKANVLSDYLKSVFTEEPPEDPPAIGDSLPTLPPLTFSCDGIQKFLTQLNPNKASGPDNIPIRMLKECAPQIAPLLQALFTQSLHSGTLPTGWHTALITPLFKKGDRSLPWNHRPVHLYAVNLWSI